MLDHNYTEAPGSSSDGLPSDAKPIPDFPDYLVTPSGEIWSTRGSKVRKLRPSRHAKGYKAVTLCGEGFQRKEYVHRLVVVAHGGGFEPGQETRHLDSDPSNNRIENLVPGSAAENALDRIRRGSAAKKLDPDKVRAIRAAQGPGCAIAKRFDISKSLVSQIRRRKWWRHVRDEPVQLSFMFAQPKVASQKGAV